MAVGVSAGIGVAIIVSTADSGETRRPTRPMGRRARGTEGDGGRRGSKRGEERSEESATTAQPVLGGFSRWSAIALGARGHVSATVAVGPFRPGIYIKFGVVLSQISPPGPHSQSPTKHTPTRLKGLAGHDVKSSQFYRRSFFVSQPHRLRRIPLGGLSRGHPQAG